MNVKELREQLAKMPDDAIVILQSDPEGNDFHKILGADLDEVYETDLVSDCGHEACSPGTYVKWPYYDLSIDDEMVVVIFP